MLATAILAGPESARAMSARREAWRRVIAARADDAPEDVTRDEIRAAGAWTVAGCVISWDGFTTDGETPLECTLENAGRVFQAVPWALDQCELAFGRRSNFTRG